MRNQHGLKPNPIAQACSDREKSPGVHGRVARKETSLKAQAGTPQLPPPRPWKGLESTTLTWYAILLRYMYRNPLGLGVVSSPLFIPGVWAEVPLGSSPLARLRCPTRRA